MSGSCNEGGGAGGTDTHKALPSTNLQTTLGGCFPAIPCSFLVNVIGTEKQQMNTTVDNPHFCFRLGSRASLQLGPRKGGVKGAVTKRPVREPSLPEAFNSTVSYSENDEVNQGRPSICAESSRPIMHREYAPSSPFPEHLTPSPRPGVGHLT